MVLMVLRVLCATAAQVLTALMITDHWRSQQRCDNDGLNADKADNDENDDDDGH